MNALVRSSLVFLSACSLASAAVGQFQNSGTPPQQTAASAAQVVEKAMPSVALVLAGEGAGSAPESMGTAVVVRQDGVLLTAYHVVRDASAVQIRLKSGEVYDQVQLLGVDARRDVAAIRISATGLPVMPMAPAGAIKAGDPVTAIGHPESLLWSTSSGIVSAYRMADEVPGAGSGFRLIQFTAASSAGSSGGVLIDGQGRALGLIVGTLSEGQNLNFAVPVENVMGLADAPSSRTFADGSALTLPRATSAPTAAQQRGPNEPVRRATPNQQERSDLLRNSRDPNYILSNFRTMYINCDKAAFFGSEQLKAALGSNGDFAALNIVVVNDPNMADTELKVVYTFAWDYPFELVYQNTSTTLVTGIGYGPFSGPLGAESVAYEFVKLMQPYRRMR